MIIAAKLGKWELFTTSEGHSSPAVELDVDSCRIWYPDTCPLRNRKIKLHEETSQGRSKYLKTELE